MRYNNNKCQCECRWPARLGGMSGVWKDWHAAGVAGHSRLQHAEPGVRRHSARTDYDGDHRTRHDSMHISACSATSQMRRIILE